MKIWIDQNECIGVGTCVDVCPNVFRLDADGVAEIAFDGCVYRHNEVADIPAALLEPVLDAAEDCPQSCIYVDI